MRRSSNGRTARGAPILALDVPSGLDAETGQAHAPAIRATATATFIALKPGPADRRRSRLLRRHLRACARARRSPARAHGHRLDWAALACTLPAVLARRDAQREQGHVRHARHPGRHRRHGRRADPRGTRRAAHRRGQGVARLPDGRSAQARHRHARADAAARGRGARCRARCARRGTGPRHQRCRALAAAARARAAGAGRARRRRAQPRSRAIRHCSPPTQARTAPTLATPHPGEAARVLASDVDVVQGDRMRAARELVAATRARTSC